MTEYGYTINGTTHPEGYITDLQFPTAHQRSIHSNDAVDISVSLANLPITGSVIFHIEEINTHTSDASRFFIIARSQNNTNAMREFYSTDEAVRNMTVNASGVRELSVQYQSRFHTHGEHVRLKYKGRN